MIAQIAVLPEQRSLNLAPQVDCTGGCWNQLLVNSGQVTTEEVKATICKIKWNKAAGRDKLPGECWKIIKKNAFVIPWFIEFYSLYKQNKEVLPDWKTANVASVFKKGDNSLINN